MSHPLFLRGKQGDISFVLVVVITLAAVLSAAMVMVGANKNLRVESTSISHLSQDADFVERYIVSISIMAGNREIIIGGDNATLAERFVAFNREQKSLLAQSRGFYERVVLPEAVSFVSTNEGYTLRVNSIPITVAEEKHRMQRIMSLHIDFDSQGRVHKVYKEYSS